VWLVQHVYVTETMSSGPGQGSCGCKHLGRWTSPFSEVGVQHPGAAAKGLVQDGHFLVLFEMTCLRPQG
jgi:hypothetical protein